MRSIIVEGMDGSGKDTLIEKLLISLPKHHLHERASTSLGGPVDGLAEWVRKDAHHITTSDIPHIYNRHPLISEPIYAPYRPDRPLSPGFENAAWVDAYRRIVGSAAVVVICQPPWSVVKTNLDASADGHMPGVVDNAPKLYEAYGSLVWSGRSIRYNYTADPYSSLLHALVPMLEG